MSRRSRAMDFKHWVEREGSLNRLPDVNNIVRRAPPTGAHQGDHQQTTPPFPRPYRDVREAVESDSPAGGMDAAWTQDGGCSGRISEQNQWLDAPDALAAILFVYILPLQLVVWSYCVHCVHIRGFAGFWGSTERPLCVRVRPLEAERSSPGSPGVSAGCGGWLSSEPRAGGLAPFGDAVESIFDWQLVDGVGVVAFEPFLGFAWFS